MKLQKVNCIFWLAVALLAAAACKKDDDDTVYPSLNGSLGFEVPQFVNPGYVAKMTPEGISHPDGKGIGYYWKVTPGMTSADTTRYENGLNSDGYETDGTFTYWFPDSLGTYTVSCYGFAKDYSSSYGSKYVTVVKGGLNGSITGTGILQKDKFIEVDGIRYYYAMVNGMDWFRNNLANPAYGVPYVNAEAMSNVFGRYYCYEDAVRACPEGWRLPTDEEWIGMAEYIKNKELADAYGIIPGIAADLMADIQFNQEDMWEYWPAVGEITNRSRLAFIPSGYANLGNRSSDGSFPAASFFGVNEYSVFWTADMVDDEEGMAYYRYLISDQPDMQIGKGDIRTHGASVRCVRDAE